MREAILYTMRISNDCDFVSGAPHQRSNSRAKSRAIVHFNIGGLQFQILRAALDRIPNSKLSSLKETDVSYIEEMKHFYFDRNPYLFPFILDVYRTGRIHFPHNMCWQYIEEELTYWELGEECIAECCWRHFKCMEHESTTLAQIEKNLKVRQSRQTDRLCGRNVSSV